MDTPVTTLQKPTIAKESFASIIEIQLQPGKTEELAAIAEEMRPDLEKLEGLKQFILVDRGQDKALAISFYAKSAEQEAATPKAQELLARWSHIVTVPPVRTGCKVLVHQIF